MYAMDMFEDLETCLRQEIHEKTDRSASAITTYLAKVRRLRQEIELAAIYGETDNSSSSGDMGGYLQGKALLALLIVKKSLQSDSLLNANQGAPSQNISLITAQVYDIIRSGKVGASHVNRLALYYFRYC